MVTISMVWPMKNSAGPGNSWGQTLLLFTLLTMCWISYFG